METDKCNYHHCCPTPPLQKTITQLPPTGAPQGLSSPTTFWLLKLLNNECKNSTTFWNTKHVEQQMPNYNKTLLRQPTCSLFPPQLAQVFPARSAINTRHCKGCCEIFGQGMVWERSSGTYTMLHLAIQPPKNSHVLQVTIQPQTSNIEHLQQLDEMLKQTTHWTTNVETSEMLIHETCWTTEQQMQQLNMILKHKACWTINARCDWESHQVCKPTCKSTPFCGWESHTEHTQEHILMLMWQPHLQNC